MINTRRTETFKAVTLITALAAAFYAFVMIFYVLRWVPNAVQWNGVNVSIAYGIVTAVIVQFVIIAGVLALAYYVFGVYGKRPSVLFPLSLFAFALSQLLRVVFKIIDYPIVALQYGVSLGDMMNFDSFIRSLVILLIGLLLLAVAAMNFEKTKPMLKAIPPIVGKILLIVAAAIVFIQGFVGFAETIFSFAKHSYFDFWHLLHGFRPILDVLYFAPFLLFTLFCSPEYKRAN